jgi:hypothetical protein
LPTDPRGLADEVERQANAGMNVYLEARTLDPGVDRKSRGEKAATLGVWAMVVDSDADIGKAATLAVKPSLVVSTSLSNAHLWLLLDAPVAWDKAEAVGLTIKATAGGDGDSCVPTGCYRVPGSINYPNAAKQARGRTVAEPVSIVGPINGAIKFDDLAKVYPPRANGVNPASSSTGGIDIYDPRIPDDLRELIVAGSGPGMLFNAAGAPDRSETFATVVVRGLWDYWGASADQIYDLLASYPAGIAQKFYDRGHLRQRVDIEHAKTVANWRAWTQAKAQAKSARSAPPPPPPPPPPSPPPSGAASTPGAAPQPPLGAKSARPTIKLTPGHMPQAVAEIEQALLLTEADVFVRAGKLVRPCVERVPAVGGGKTKDARLTAFVPHSFIVAVARAAIYRRHDRRSKTWVVIDPPRDLACSLLNQGQWRLRRIAGVITTPVLREDGSLLDAPGYDPATELYLMPSVALPPIPDKPSRDDALKALALILDLFAEFPFKSDLDQAVAVAGLLTALMRGALPAAPIILVTAGAPGSGKSYLVNVIAAVVTGRPCPAVTLGTTQRETETRLGAILLAGSQIVSLDNLTSDLNDPLLCQMAEQQVVGARILGLSEMPNCESRTMLFATGNNVGFTGDMARRGITCELDAREERPELRKFQHNARRRAGTGRGKYIAAAFTIVRAHIAVGSPAALDPIGSYEEWCSRVRDPLVWLGMPDPGASMSRNFEKDDVLGAIREFFALWPDYLQLNHPYEVSQIIYAGMGPALMPLNALGLFLVRAAGIRGKPGEVSEVHLARWFRSICGRTVDGRRLLHGRDPVTRRATYSLE